MYCFTSRVVMIAVFAFVGFSCRIEDANNVNEQNSNTQAVNQTSSGLLIRDADSIIQAHSAPIKTHQLRLAEEKDTVQDLDSQWLRLRPDIANLPIGISPAYLLGDVNEDGYIDVQDLELTQRFVNSIQTTQALREVSCAAAADMDQNGKIDAYDVELLNQYVAEGPVSSGMLYDQTTLPCKHSRSFVAFNQTPICQAPLQAHLLPFSPLRGIRLDESSDGTMTQSNDLPGWQFTFTEALLVATTPAIVFTHAGNFFIYQLSNFCALQPSTELSENDWGITPIPAGEQTGRPTEYGSEINNLQQCPQENGSCEALIIDFLANSALWQEPDATATRDALVNAGCNVLYSAPIFVKVPPRPTIRTYTPSSYSSYSEAHRLNQLEQHRLTRYEQTLSRVLTGNRLSWQGINTNIATHRSRLRNGAALAYQMVNAHGSEGSGGTCGKWGVGFDTGTGTLSRDQFHRGNYRAQRKNVCYAVMEDRSCHSGLSANALDWLNNFSLVSCGTPPKANHRRHSAFYNDMVMTTAEAPNSCTMATLTLRDYTTASYINNAPQDAGFKSLAQAFLVRGIGLGQNASGFYTDNGYNQIPGKSCQGASRRY